MRGSERRVAADWGGNVTRNPRTHPLNIPATPSQARPTDSKWDAQRETLFVFCIYKWLTFSPLIKQSMHWHGNENTSIYTLILCICATDSTKLNKFSELLEVILPVFLEQIMLEKPWGWNDFQITRSKVKNLDHNVRYQPSPARPMTSRSVPTFHHLHLSESWLSR